MNFYRNYFNNIDRQMTQREYIQNRLQKESQNESVEVKAKRRREINRMMKEIEEIGSEPSGNAYEMATQGY